MAIEFGISKLPLAERIEFMRTLASWLQSGGGRMPVNEAIRNTCDAFSRDEYRSLAGRMNRITTDYDSGQVRFFEALKISQLGFSEQEIAVLEAAELSNQLRTAVPDIVEALQMRLESTRMLVRRMTMPVVGGFMLILMSLGVAKFMLPMVLGPVIQRNPDALAKFPLVVQLFWAFSQWLQDAWPIVIALFSVPPILFFARNTKFAKGIVEKLMWSFAPTKRISLAFNGVMVVYYMPALVRSGMPMHDVLRFIAGSIENSLISSAFRIAANEHEAGVRLSDALGRVPLRGSFRSAVEAGEKTGAIAERVEDLKAPYAAEYERIVRRAVSTLTLIVMAGLMPMFIFSMYTSLVAPIFALMEY